MVKPIRITLEVEQIALGKVWTTLDGMAGVISIGLHGNGPKPAAKKKGTKHGSSATVPCIVLGALNGSKKPLGKPALIEFIVAGGKAAASLADTLTKLKKDKHIAPVGDGLFKITPAGVKRYQTACQRSNE